MVCLRESILNASVSTRAVTAVLLVLLLVACGGKEAPSYLPELRVKREPDTSVGLPRAAITGVRETEFAPDPIEEMVRGAVAAGDFTPIERVVAELLPEQREGWKAAELRRIYRVFDALAEEPNVEQTKATLDRWVAAHPQSHAVWLARGEFLKSWSWVARGHGWSRDVKPANRKIFRERLALAEGDLKKALSLEKRDPNSSAGLMQIAMILGDCEGVNRYYDTSMAASPSQLRARMTMVTALMPKWCGSEREMFAYAEACAREAERYPYAGLVPVVALLERHEFPETMGTRSFFAAFFGTNKNDVPSDPLAYAEAWRMVEDAFDKFFTRYPDDVEQRYFYVDVAERTEHWDVVAAQANAIGRQWISWEGSAKLEEYRKTASYAYQHHAYYAKLQPARAKFYYQEAIDLTPDDADVHYNYGVMLQKTNDSVEAVREYRRAMELKPKDIDPYLGIMAIHGGRGDCTTVLELGARASGLEMDDEDATDLENMMNWCRGRR